MSTCLLRRTPLASSNASRFSAVRACGCALALLATLLTLPFAHAEEPTPSVEQLLTQAEAARSADPAKFAALLQQLDQRADQGTPSQREQIRYLDAYRMAYGGDFKGAIADLHDLFDNATDSTVRFKAAAFLINNYALTRQLSEGLALLDGMLALLPQIREPALRQQGLAVASFTYNQVGQYQSGLDFANMLLSENPTERTRCFANSNLFEAQFNIDAEPLQDEVLRSAIDQCLTSREMIGATSIRVVLARKWLREGRPDAALVLLDGTLEKTESTQYPLLIGGIHSLLATIRLGKKELAGAERHAQRAIEMSTGNTYALPMVDAYKVLYEISLARGDMAAALERYRKYAEADKAYLNDVKAREIAYQLARQQTEQKNQTIALLNQQNEVLRLQQTVTTQEAQNARWRLIIVATLLVLVVGSVVFWGVKVKRLQHSLQRLAETDSLTGVCNRHHFSACAERLLAQAQREGAPIALVIFDLDHFKNINDSHGHPAGDLVLRHATQLCRRHVRDGDLIGRLGGEEFALLLRNCDRHAAAQIAEDCRRHLADLRVRHADTLLRVTASFGVACAGVSGYALKELVAHADKALYAAKRAGRNCVNVHADATAPA